MSPSQIKGLLALAWKHKRMVLIKGPPGTGKGLDLSTPIPTPQGWTTMGALKVGDMVLGPDGLPTQVTLVSETHNLPCYRLTFSDSTSVVADCDHRWQVLDMAKRDRKNHEVEILTTLEMHQRGVGLANGKGPKRSRFKLLPIKPAQLPTVDLPLDPYVMGVWLGDGHRGRGMVSKPNPELWQEIERRGFSTKCMKGMEKSGTRSIWLPDGSCTISALIKSTGCRDTKEIPAMYLRASYLQRLELLKGIVDTDGYAAPGHSSVEVVTVNKKFACQLMELLRSLGWPPSYNEGRATIDGVDKGPKYRVGFAPDVPVGYTSRITKGKQYATQTDRYYSRFVRSLTKVKTRPTRCIKVANQDCMYLCGEGWVPTHNTDTVKATAEENGFALWIGHPAISEVVDFKGFPVSFADEKKRRKVEFLPDVHLDLLCSADRPTVAFLDDVGQAPATVQAALMQLLQERRLNGHALSPHVVFCGATNESTHSAGVGGFIEPFKGRWDTIVEMQVSLDDWVSWAFANKMPDVLIAFLRTRTELLHAFKPSRGLDRSPDPRSWAKAGCWINEGMTHPEVLSGAVGIGAATELGSFITLATKVPDIDLIIAKPDTSPIPEELSLQYLVATALARRATPGNMAKVMKYLNRLSQSLRTLCLRDAVNVNPNVSSTDSYVKWAREEGRELIY